MQYIGNFFPLKSIRYYVNALKICLTFLFTHPHIHYPDMHAGTMLYFNMP